MCAPGGRASLRRIAQGEVTAREVVEAHLGRIDEVNPTGQRGHGGPGGLGSCRGSPDRQRGRRRTASWPAGRGPVHDQGEPRRGRAPDHRRGRGLPGSGGCGRRPSGRQLRAADAIPLARTNMPDLGMRWHTDSGLFGATPQPVGPRLVTRRIQRRRGGCAGRPGCRPWASATTTGGPSGCPRQRPARSASGRRRAVWPRPAPPTPSRRRRRCSCSPSTAPWVVGSRRT